VAHDDDHFLDRAVPARDRRSFARELLDRQLEDLNGLGDRLRYLAEHDAPEEERAELRARAEAIVAALGYNAEEVVRLTWEWLATPLRYPEDAYAPALVLGRLDPDPARVRAWHEGLCDEVRSHLDPLLAAHSDSTE
jgi:hypothetical protein